MPDLSQERIVLGPGIKFECIELNYVASNPRHKSGRLSVVCLKERQIAFRRLSR